MTFDLRNTHTANLPDEFIDSLESYILGVISVEQLRRRIASLLHDNLDWGAGMLMAIDHAFQQRYVNGTAYRLLITEIDLATSEDEPTEWSEETQEQIAREAAEAKISDAPQTEFDTAPPVSPKIRSAAAETKTARPVEAVTSGIGPGTLLRHRYLLLEQIGGGSMGKVFKAVDRGKEAEGVAEPWVAIKILSPQFASSPSALAALKQEAAHGRRLSHPNIIRTFDFDWDGDQYFITMEWLEGQPLVDILNAHRFRPLDPDHANSIIEGLCHGLMYAHAQNVVHADIKPGNVFITRAGLTKLLDFGIARATGGAPAEFDAASIRAHTPAYSSCEVLEGAATEPVDDVYSLGCLAYRLLAGRRAFGGATALEAESRQLKPERIATLTESQWRALRGALALRRVDRTADVATFFAEFSEQTTVEMTRPMPAGRAGNPRAARSRLSSSLLKFGLAVVVAALTAVALLAWWAESPEIDMAQAPDQPQQSVPYGPPPIDGTTPGLAPAAKPAAEPATPPGNPGDAPAEGTAADPPVQKTSAAPATQVNARPAIETRTPAQPASPAPRNAVKDRVSELLEKANRRMDDGKLIEPLGDNAHALVIELQTLVPDSPEFQQTRLRLANLMLLEAMVAINDEQFATAERWLAATRELAIAEAMLDRYESQLRDARAAKATRKSESLGAIFASATPAAILADPDVSFELVEPTSADAATAAPATRLTMAVPGETAEPGGDATAIESEREPEPELTPLSALEFRRFVEPRYPRGTAARRKSGWVELQFGVDAKGNTVDVRVVDSTLPDVFADAALRAVRRWRFRPHTVDGRVTPTESGIRLQFEPR